MADKLSRGEKLRIRFAQELLANRDSSLVSAAVHGYDAALEDLRSEEARGRVARQLMLDEYEPSVTFEQLLDDERSDLLAEADAVIAALLGEKEQG